MTENNFEEFDNDLNQVDPDKLIFTIWNQPKLTLRYILERCPEKNVFLFFVLGGIVDAISRAANKGMGDTMSLMAVLLITVIAGGLFGWISYFIYAWTLSWTGKWLDGKAEPERFRTVLAWSLVPSIATIILLIPELLVLGEDLFKSTMDDDSMFSNISLIVFGVLEIVLSVWSLVILVTGIKLVQGFGTGKAILNLILPALVILVPLFLLIYIFTL